MAHRPFKQCEDCGAILAANQYSELYCPRCHDRRVKDMVEETKGGYY